ncbi:MAG: TolC family protein [Bryobacterales bacterium]|jgi:outer membrane protein|nr:TolC family protein [Bryobacterales bacterium]
MRFSYSLPRVLALLSLPALAFAQQALTPPEIVEKPASFFPQPTYFRQAFRPASPRIELQAPVRISDFAVNGNIELSLRSYLELVLANNTDIAISRLTIDTAKTGILRAYGPFDPVGIAAFNSNRVSTPTNDLLAGAEELKTLSQPLQLGYQHTLESGTQYNVSFNGRKFTTNSDFANFNPAINTDLSFGFAQPLLRGRGQAINRLPIMIARSRLRQTEYTFHNSLLQLVNQAEVAYWRAIELRENLRVQQSSLKLAEEFLKRAQRELELGAISRLDIFQPEFQFAQAQGNVAQFEFQVQQQDDILRRLMGIDLDPEYRKRTLVLTEAPTTPEDPRAIDAEAMVTRALGNRPDLRSTNQNIDIDDLQIRQANNGLLPQLTLTGNYAAVGRGGVFFQRQNVFTETGDRATIVNVIPGGVGNALSQMFGLNFPGYSFGLRLTLPIRNRAAQADYAAAVIAKRRDMLQVRNVEQQIRQDVLVAVSQVEASKATVALAAKALDFAQKRLDAEQKKYDLGTSTIFLVLQAQNDLISAQSALVRESVNFKRNETALLRATGELLEQRGIRVD